MTITIRITVNGQQLDVGDGVSVPPEPTGAYATDTLSLSWGRDNTTDQPEASTVTFGVARPGHGRGPIKPWLHLGATVLVEAIYLAGSAVVFLGSVTSLSEAWDFDRGCPVVSVTADDVLADLGQRRIGAAPFPLQSLIARVATVLAITRQDVQPNIAPTVSGVAMARQDIDVRTATDVLQQVAASVDGVLWPDAVNLAGTVYPGIRLEDLGQRPALHRLARQVNPPVGGAIVVVQCTDGVPGLVTIDGCVPELAPVTFTQDIQDRVTRVSVTYYTPDVDPTAPLLGITVDLVDAVAEDPSGAWGVRGVDLDTLLTSAVDAQTYGSRILARLRMASWMAEGLQWDQADTPALSDDLVFQLLNVRTRGGTPVAIDLPSWAPEGDLAGYLEGGLFAYALGSWTVALFVSAGQSYGAAECAWNQLPDDPTWAWQYWVPTWDELNGVGPPVGV